MSNPYEPFTAAWQAFEDGLENRFGGRNLYADDPDYPELSRCYQEGVQERDRRREERYKKEKKP